MNYITPCGMHVRTEPFVIAVMDGLWYMNEHHVCIAPMMKKCENCEHILVQGKYAPILCGLKELKGEFDYESSVNKIRREYDLSYHKEYREITKWDYCPNITQKYDKAVKRYDIKRCIQYNCMNKVCSITGKERDTEPVNIFYDLKLVEKVGFLEFVNWERDLKYFDKRIARELAERKIRIIQKEEPEKLNLRIQSRVTKSLVDDLERVRVIT